MSKNSLLVSSREIVDCLLKSLNKQNVKVERAISLRSAFAQIKPFSIWLKIMKSANVDVSQIESATKNEQEFDTHVNSLKNLLLPPFVHKYVLSKQSTKRKIY